MVTLAIRPLVLIFIVSAFFYVLIEQSIMSWLPTFNSQVFIYPQGSVFKWPVSLLFPQR